ncbi:MAG: MFS transporter [Streptosporangiales bacterium]|nr:MFS transporter [Streptosporangiales bacterium]
MGSRAARISSPLSEAHQSMATTRPLQPPLALTILTGVVAQGVSSGLQQGLPSMAPALREQVHTTPATLSLLLAATGIGVTCAVLVCGILADRVGERAVVVAGMSLCTVSLVLASRQTVFAGLLIFLLMAGFGLAGPNGAVGKALAIRAGPGRLGLALGLRQMAVPLGTAGATYLLPRIAAEHGAGTALLVLSGVFLAAVALSAVGFGRADRSGGAGQGLAIPALRTSLADRRLLYVMVGCGLFTFPQWGYLGYAVLFLHDERGWDGVAAATLLTAVLLGGGLMRAAVGWFSDRVPHRRSALLAGFGAAAGVLSLVAGFTAATGSSWVVPLLAAATVTSMGWNGLAFTVVAAACPPEQLGGVHGVLSTILFAGGAIAAVVVGLIRAASSWPVTWASLALFSAAGLFLLWRSRPLAGEGCPRRRPGVPGGRRGARGDGGLTALRCGIPGHRRPDGGDRHGGHGQAGHSEADEHAGERRVGRRLPTYAAALAGIPGGVGRQRDEVEERRPPRVL